MQEFCAPSSPGRHDPAHFLGVSKAILESLYAESHAAHWGLTLAQFAAALDRSLRKRFPDVSPAGDLVEYLQTLCLQDLALGEAGLGGAGRAWEYFVRDYGSLLGAAAGAIEEGGHAGADVQELDD